MSEEQQKEPISLEDVFNKSNLNSVLYDNLDSLNDEAKAELDFHTQNTNIIVFILDWKPTLTFDFDQSLWKGAVKLNTEPSEYVIVEDQSFVNVIFGLIEGVSQKQVK